MRRSASEIIRNLETRVARLERLFTPDPLYRIRHSLASSPMQSVRRLAGTKLLGYTLESSPTGALRWTNGYMNHVNVVYEEDLKNGYLILVDVSEGNQGRLTIGRVEVGPDSDSVKADFLKESKRVLRRL